jgi:hypothetical protein
METDMKILLHNITINSNQDLAKQKSTTPDKYICTSITDLHSKKTVATHTYYHHAT